MTNGEFIKNIAFYIQKYAPEYDIRVCSAIIAQAIIESGWGNSKLSSVYHNYFGLTCGSGWTGKSVNMKTWEEYTPGTKTDIRQNFRVYDSMDAGVKGYFEFIKYPRYQNLRGITDPEKYLQTIKADGYATASNYVSVCMGVVNQYNLQQYDTIKVPAPAVTDPDPVTKPVDKPVYSFEVEEVREGSRGKSVALLQKLLNGLDYMGLDGYAILVDAAAGPNTIYALKCFQEAAGITVDGICGEKSWKILIDL